MFSRRKVTRQLMESHKYGMAPALRHCVTLQLRVTPWVQTFWKRAACNSSTDVSVVVVIVNLNNGLRIRIDIGIANRHLAGNDFCVHAFRPPKYSTIRTSGDHWRTALAKAILYRLSLPFQLATQFTSYNLGTI